MAQTRAPADERRAIGLRLRELRKGAGVTTMDLAIVLGITPGAVEQIEQGKSSIRGESLPVIAEMLDMPLEEVTRRLYGIDDEFHARRAEHVKSWKDWKSMRESVSFSLGRAARAALVDMAPRSFFAPH